MRSPLYCGDPAYGPLCACGNGKAKQARTCQPCHSRLRGYGRSGKIQALLSQPGVQRKIEVAAFAGELAGLVAEQAADDRRRFVWDPQTVSLDAPNRAGRRLIDVLAA